ncbi:hypothetical protein, partial [Flavobacterium sp.]|uniref:hypothetical protein n=1 Tax=Flavobacterium sp. TaxID=239 RepID=UPI002FDCCB70
PKTKYKVEINFDDLTSSNSVYVLRRSELPQDETFHKFNDGSIILNDDALLSERIPELSLNLMGGVFKLKHSAFVPIKNGSKVWTGGKIYLSEYFSDYKIDNQNGCIYINANQLHNKTVPYEIESNPNLHKEIEKFIRTVGPNGTNNVIRNSPPDSISLLGKIYFKHVPVNLNYWHIELKTENFKLTSLKKATNKTDTRFVEVIFNDWIKMNSYPSIQNIQEIKKVQYINTAY